VFRLRPVREREGEREGESLIWHRLASLRSISVTIIASISTLSTLAIVHWLGFRLRHRVCPIRNPIYHTCTIRDRCSDGCDLANTGQFVLLVITQSTRLIREANACNESKCLHGKKKKGYVSFMTDIDP
jgi:hypothetical protein